MAERESSTTVSIYARFFRGEREAVAELAALHRTGLVLFINGYVRNLDVAEDLASDAFATLLIKRPKMKNETHFKTYLFSMGKNAALSYLRKNKRVPLERESISEGETPESALVREERRRAVVAAIGKMKGEYRDVLLLRFYEELSVDDIAKILRKNKKQVYNLLQRAKSTLKEILKKENIVYEAD